VWRIAQVGSLLSLLMRRLVLSVLAVAAIVGCGDDEGSETGGSTSGGAATSATTTAAKPAAHGELRPAEPAELEVARLARAVRSDDCSAPDELFIGPTGSPRLCHRLLPRIGPKLPPEVKTYGSGAVVTNANGGHSILALDSDRRFKFAVAFTAPHPPRVPVKVADESMAAAVGAIRRDNCDDILKWAYSGVKRFCASPEIRQLHAALDRAYTASPTALGGDGTFAFYGLRVKPHYFTLVFLASPNGSYFFVTSVRA
jgi:hypothetical protein